MSTEIIFITSAKSISAKARPFTLTGDSGTLPARRTDRFLVRRQNTTSGLGGNRIHGSGVSAVDM
jgi:ferric-dicitrate binding protein FerR (iron transport regulator)